MKIKLFVTILAISFFLLGIGACREKKKPVVTAFSPVMVVSVSSDGKYVVSSHQKNEIVLWDIANKKRILISSNGNIYSAYFVRNCDLFMWQDLEDVVHIDKLDGAEVKSFAHVPTYGHVVTSDLKHYFSSDIDWTIYYGFNEELKFVKHDGDSPSFGGQGKLLNLSLSNGNRYMLSAGRGLDSHDNRAIKASPPIEEDAQYSDYAGVVLWDVTTLKPIAKLAGNSAKTYATISPDGKYVVSGCENAQSYMLEVPSYKKHRLASIYDGVWQSDGIYDDSRMIPKPNEIKHDAILTLKFIKDSEYYFRFFTYEPYVGLFSTKSPFPLKYLPLGRDPFPSVNAYTRNAAIDTAPAVGILVTGQAKKGGINVYKYHPDKQELERIWVAE